MQSSVPQATPRKLLRYAGLATAVLALTLAACKPPVKADPTKVDKVGLVLLNAGTGAGRASGQAAFVELTAARAEELMASPFGAQIGTCSVSTSGAPSVGTPADAPRGASLLAGDMTLTVGAATYGLLERGDDGRYTLRATDPLPASDMKLKLAGTGAFPAFSDVVLKAGAAPELAGGFDPSAVTTATEFAWTPGAAGAALLLVGASADGAVAYSCLADDAAGTFRFPEATRDELTSAGYDSGNLATLARISATQARSGSALLLVNTVWSTDLGAE